jgi:hypothetical protein
MRCGSKAQGNGAVSLASDRPHSRVKKTWLRILKNGTGGLIIAAAVVSAASAKAEVPDARATVSQRVEHAREWMQQRPALDPATQQPDEFAWIRWGNLLHPMWNNWPNWHNWNNWPNWPNY